MYRPANLLQLGTHYEAIGRDGAKRVRVAGELCMFQPERAEPVTRNGVRTVKREPPVAVIKDFLGSYHRLIVSQLIPIGA